MRICPVAAESELFVCRPTVVVLIEDSEIFCNSFWCFLFFFEDFDTVSTKSTYNFFKCLKVEAVTLRYSFMIIMNTMFTLFLVSLIISHRKLLNNY